MGTVPAARSISTFTTSFTTWARVTHSSTREHWLSTSTEPRLRRRVRESSRRRWMASVRRLRLPVSESRRELRPSNVHSSEMTRRLRPSKGNCFCDGSKRSVSGRGFLQGRLLLLVFLASARNGNMNLEQCAKKKKKKKKKKLKKSPKKKKKKKKKK